MNNQYYTPSIEEFHIGFRYEAMSCNEYNSDIYWSKLIYPLDPFMGENISLKSNMTDLRVKLLDKKDIEELGWKFQYDYKNNGSLFYFDDISLLAFNNNTKECRIREINEEGSTTIIFKGTIKNYNELQKLMVQLNIK